MTKKKAPAPASPEPTIPSVASASAPVAAPAAPGLHAMPPLSAEDAAVMEETPVVPTKPLTDYDVIDGGILNSSFGDEVAELQARTADPAEEPAATSPVAAPSLATVETPATQAPSSAEKKTYRAAGREFDSPEAMQAFIDGREQSQQDLLDKIATPTQPTAPADPLPEDIWFDDPKKAAELLRKQIRDEVAAENRVRDQSAALERQRAQTWELFYATNPDLKGFEDEVGAVSAKVAADPELAKLPSSKGLQIVAERTRAKIAVLRQRLTPTEALPTGPTTVASSTTAAAPSVPTATPPSNFITEVRSLGRNKGVL